MTALPTAPPWSDLIRARLFYGHDKPRTLSDLAEQLRVSRRVVEKAIEESVLNGAPIVTGSDGAWLTTSPSELEAAAAALDARALRIMGRAKALRATAARIGGQQDLGLSA